jgi:hypothetical protein
LEAAFVEWAKEHGPIWWPNEERLAEAVAAHLGIKLTWGRRGSKTKVTYGEAGEGT